MLQVLESHGVHASEEEVARAMEAGTRLTLSRGYRDTIQARLGRPL